ncbi:MAG TPA: hypothetical protein VG122_26015 [Gemmata sp.]|nr:hypothetical protein [Gemmata sp.]
MTRRGLPTLAEFCRRRDVAVLGDLIQVGAREWDRLMLCLRESERVQRLVDERPGLGKALRVSHAQAGAQPFRIYECFHRGCIYLSYPYTFRPEQDIPGWYRVAFDLPGEWVLQGRLHIGTGAVEIEAAHSPGQYIAELTAAQDRAT